MTAAELVAAVGRAGGELQLDGEQVRFKRLPRQLVERLRERKTEVVDELRRREVVLVAARLLRECRWAVEPPVCVFHVGKGGERCRRCGASWLEHYPAPTDGPPP